MPKLNQEVTILRVAVPSPLRYLFDYLPPLNHRLKQIKPGMRVLVPFGNRKSIGVVLEVANSSQLAINKLKVAAAILDEEPLLSKKMLEFITWTSNYYHHPLGELFKNVLPTLLRQTKSKKSYASYHQEIKPTHKKTVAAIEPNQHQTQAINTIKKNLTEFKTFLLNGVTGSGKTEVYLAYPVHLDEWMHMARAEAIADTGSITFVYPFTGEGYLGLRSNPETGYHVLLAIIQQVSGIDWVVMFRYLPALVFIFTVVSVYLVARRLGFGLEAAFFAALMPTTVGILGPSFAVPLAVGLLYAALVMLLVFRFDRWWSYPILFLLTSALLTMHSVSLAIILVIVLPYLVLAARRNPKHAIGVLAAVLIPVVITLPFTGSMVLEAGRSLLSTQPLLTFVDLPNPIYIGGLVCALLSLVGMFALALRRDRASLGLALGFVALVVVLAAFYWLHRGVIAVFYRGLPYALLIMAIVGGAGLSWVVRSVRSLRRLTALLKPAVTTYVLASVLVGVTLGTVIPIRLHTWYYHMINDEDYRAFVWIRQNLDPGYRRTALDPWQGIPFAALSGQFAYTFTAEFPLRIGDEVNKFLIDGCLDTAFLEKHDITMVYTRLEVHNRALAEVMQNVYVLQSPEQANGGP